MQRQRKLPLRKCVGCQGMFPKRELIRVVLTPEEQILLDPTGKRNGRGAYVCANPDCLRQARKRKSLERALKHPIPEGVYDELEARLAEVSPGGA
ncbi:RNase P modulator RnpM [Alicyclobacillus macrosporangiidus]|uniref:RNase P modulator RnpM n=1 Tax=Alicyclobacillus macrosporangiidus TaxID=392015 RepID=UPI0004964A2E|nr:YlxR family protein [Alicyclobacillus macrosporangiidus]MCL6597330.1 YlxR family protein [Alicyclobacillus macrosporangiidus]